MAKVIRRENESVDDLIKRFKTLVKKEEILLEFRKHTYFLKKALKRKQKSKLARLKMRKHR